MKPRAPTAEELRLWRESNRFTKKILAEVEAQHEEEGDASFQNLFEGEVASDAPASRGVRRRGNPPSSPAATNNGARSESQILNPLPIREAAKRFKSHAEIEATLDLHGLSKIEAYAAVARFLVRERGKGRRHLLIITGKGREGEGILRRELPHWLNEPALRAHLSAFAHAHPTRGGAGVMHVLLKKHRD